MAAPNLDMIKCPYCGQTIFPSAQCQFCKKPLGDKPTTGNPKLVIADDAANPWRTVCGLFWTGWVLTIGYTGVAALQAQGAAKNQPPLAIPFVGLAFALVAALGLLCNWPWAMRQAVWLSWLGTVSLTPLSLYLVLAVFSGWIPFSPGIVACVIGAGVTFLTRWSVKNSFA